MIAAILVMSALALALGILIYVASKKFAMPESEKLSQLVAVLPGANCGVCGFAGCEDFAKALVEGKAKFDGCRVGREEVAVKIKRILGNYGNDAEGKKSE